MFTGIIRQFGKIINIITTGDVLTIFIEINDLKNICKGDSICINGICLTVTSISNDNVYSFDIMKETIFKTTCKEWKVSDNVNIETSIKHNELNFDGYIILGHVDGICKLVEFNTVNNEFIFELQNDDFVQYIVPKGNVCIDGVSLTISKKWNKLFSVCIIPHTYSNTIFKEYKENYFCNIELDINLKLKNENYIDITNLTGTTILSDQHAMSIAYKLSLNGRLTCKPNPWVGCIIVNNGIIIGYGYHKKAGESHAEVIAIQNVIENGYMSLLKDSTMYVTLEPCCHYGRTPPCVNSIISEKIKRVVVGIKDTDNRVSGKGIEKCLENGIQVDILDDENIKESLRSYLYNRESNKPYVYLKIACTLDGKIAAYDNSSKWITSEKSRNDVKLTLRSVSDCILTTSKTVLEDKPRFDEVSDILILDRSNKIKDEDIEYLRKKGKNVICLSEDKSINSQLEECYMKGYREILYEGGGKIFSEIIKEKCWNECIIYMNMSFLGDNAKSIYPVKLGDSMNELFEIGSIKKLEKIDDENIKITLVK